MSAILAWIAGTKFGRWIVGVGAVLVALLAALAVAFVKGEHRQASKDAAKDAQALQQAAQEAAAVNTDASAAAAKVEQQANATHPPDPVKRDDFDTTE